MHTRFLLLAVVALALALSAGTSRAQPPAGVIPDHYIVVFRDTVPRPQEVADEHAQRHLVSISHVYQFALKGYAARIPANRVDDVRNDSRVLFVSQDRE